MSKAASVIHQYGEPVKARTLEGLEVFREERIFIKSHGMMHSCLQYDNHFVYDDPSTTRTAGSTLMCTCGAAAAVIGYQHYKQYASYMGEAVACLHYTQYGKHADGSS